jgi:hypothetical protein
MVLPPKRKTHASSKRENVKTDCKPKRAASKTTTPQNAVPNVWSTLTAPILTSPNAHLKLTWHLHNPSSAPWVAPIVLSVLICKDPGASAMLGASPMPADQVLLRTKYDLDAHGDRYDYLSETLLDSIAAGESIDVAAEIGVPEVLGCYWGCFKVLRQGQGEFYCVFRHEL